MKKSKFWERRLKKKHMSGKLFDEKPRFGRELWFVVGPLGTPAKKLQKDACNPGVVKYVRFYIDTPFKINEFQTTRLSSEYFNYL